MTSDTTTTRPTLFCLHALGMSRLEFGPVADALGDDFEVVALDLPGFGEATEPPEPLAPDVLTAVVSRLDEGLAVPTPRTRTITAGVLGGLLVPEPLRGYLARLPQQSSWTVLTSGVEALHMALGHAPVVAEILKMAPGSALPVHRHTDQELILTLQGAFSEEAGPHSAKGGCYGVGDLGEFEGGSTHTVVAGKDGCICYRVLAGPVERLAAN